MTWGAGNDASANRSGYKLRLEVRSGLRPSPAGWIGR